MTKDVRVGLIMMFFALLFIPFFQLQSQPTFQETDEIVFKIYNQDFCGITDNIENLRKSSPQIALYLNIDFLWWKMISDLNEKTEAVFLAGLDSLNETNSDNQDFNKLACFLYQIRYENLRNKNFSKYLTILKFHLYVENISSKKAERFGSFEKSIFQMITELNSYMKYKFLEDYGLQTKKNTENCKMSLAKIENLQNTGFKSFDVIKTYFLGKIYLEIENNNQQAILKFEKLSGLFPKNAIFKKTLSDCKK
jgi:hypothetical protein